ncbi:hypothetical protein ACLOJK_002788 [Asimina triloba]
MEAAPSLELPAHQSMEIPSSFLLSSTNSTTLDEALQSLFEASRTSDGRSHFASVKLLIPSLLSLISHSLYPAELPLKILRNLCAGEISNQTSFVAFRGVHIVMEAFKSQLLDPSLGRFGLQLLGNVALAGEMHQEAVWDGFFPGGFEEIARIRESGVADPLCMIIYTCCKGNSRRMGEVCGEQGLKIISEIFTTTTAVGFKEDLLPLLVEKICFQESNFASLFLALSSSKNNNILQCPFTTKQAFLLSLLQKAINQQIDEVHISSDFAVAVLEVLKNASQVVDCNTRGQSAIPTGSPAIDVLGYSLNILRDICAHEDPTESSAVSAEGSLREGQVHFVDSLVSSGLLDLLLHLLRELEPPEILRKSRGQEENQGKVCPYIGYRSDIVAIIGNCTFQRKRVQDEIRRQNGILLLMQQCVVDKDNPYLREWGIWAVRNLLEGNMENQREVSEMELRGPANTPEITGLGLRVEVDPKSQRAKLVNDT